MKTSQKAAFKPNLSLSFVKTTSEYPSTHKKNLPTITFKSNDPLKKKCAKLNSSKDLVYQHNIIDTEEFYRQDDSKVSLIEFTDPLLNNEKGHESFLSRTISNNECSSTVYQLNEDLESLFESKPTTASSLQLPYNVNFTLLNLESPLYRKYCRIYQTRKCSL
jgi:hypothetical protein